MKIEKDLSEIRQVYADADKAGKALMEKLYSKMVLCDITQRVTTFETACASLPPYEEPEETPIDEVAYGKLKVITEALNEGWTPDWSDSNQPKYFPWFGFQDGRFVFDGVRCAYLYSFLGSRLCFRTRELAEYAGKQFEDLYNLFLN
jgi:hypothetical protein